MKGYKIVYPGHFPFLSKDYNKMVNFFEDEKVAIGKLPIVTLSF